MFRKPRQGLCAARNGVKKIMPDDALPPIRLALDAMRTRWELLLPVDAQANAADLRAAGEEALTEITQAEQLLSAFRPDSDLFRLNRDAQSGAPVRVPYPLLTFLIRAQTLCEQTDGAFDPAVGPLIAAWERAGQNGRIPTSSEIAQAQALTNVARNVVLDADAQTVTYLRPGVRLNMGAIGKGWAADKAIESLRENGIRRALLHGGTSTVYGLGAPSESDAVGWAIAVENPRWAIAGGSAPIGVTFLHNAALGVSAVHGKTYFAGTDGQTFGHVLDARTGWPVRHALLAAVRAASSTDADALSTALLVLGAAGLPNLRTQFPDARFCVAETDDENATGDGLRLTADAGFFT